MKADGGTTVDSRAGVLLSYFADFYVICGKAIARYGGSDQRGAFDYYLNCYQKISH